ncbi:MAG TPA: aminotransferase class V-fold PLP-dependent enzyme [Terracidiphilus sp.]|jgi:glutamate/tyrosine decarboxylase-like PLP-dependent enzyme
MHINQIREEFATLESTIADGLIVPNVTAGEIRAFLGSRFDFKQGMPLDDVIADVEQMLRTWQVQVTHPRYFGLYNPSVTLASVVADTLVAMYNSQLANWRTSPAANEMERHTLAWLAEKFGLRQNAIATFTSGGSEANLTAVVVALTWAFPEYGECGLRSLNGDPAIYLTAETHHGFNKIAHMTGLGRRNLRVVATDSSLKMSLEDLEKRVAEDRGNGFLPFMVIGTAGTTAAGVIDPLPEIARFAKTQRLWFHADAAYGGSAVVSPSLRPFLAGIELADSITCDAHKWLSVPMGCGMFFCRHRESVAQAFRSDVTYMPAKPESEDASATFNPLTHSAQWSRRFIGLKLFMALAEHGERGYADMLDHQARMGDVLRELLSSSGWLIVNSTPLPIICFTRDGVVPQKLAAELRERQIAWMSDAQIGGIPAVRACITSFKTTEKDIEWVMSQMNDLASNMSHQKTA